MTTHHVGFSCEKTLTSLVYANKAGAAASIDGHTRPVDIEEV